MGFAPVEDMFSVGLDAVLAFENSTTTLAPVSRANPAKLAAFAFVPPDVLHVT